MNRESLAFSDGSVKWMSAVPQCAIMNVGKVLHTTKSCQIPISIR